MKNKMILLLLVVLGLFFTYKALISNGKLDIHIGYLFVALVAFVESYIVFKKK